MNVDHSSLEMVETKHPTEKGAKTLLSAIDRVYDQDIIWQPQYISNSRKYQGVNAVYCYGCKCCDALGRFGPKGMCAGCASLARVYKDEKAWEVVDQVIRHGKRKNNEKDENVGENIHCLLSNCI